MEDQERAQVRGSDMKKNVTLCLAKYRNHLRNKVLVAIQHKKTSNFRYWLTKNDQRILGRDNLYTSSCSCIKPNQQSNL
ncbi:hypothetical protein VCRA2113O415_60029 [Vibrio crassostreae]|nr:hypothetical protein VCRA2110O182_180029 [Vibrio crassostreae]CAK2279414.1 hypothetical protein VCRA2111O408_170068 [Vibrio crassostreae]CAK2294050.1 hypothetical protein VCRA211O406_180029 [Vibrio crassostreae]CAK2530008.1 hypothetical protein VCRA2113O415_60029 [Vibrio crassostreae]CAK2955065.1 hypothetical protein VCRA2113O420_60029 [Vibrio crassostreae]